MAKVELQNITKRFGKVTAIENVNLTIQDGEFFCLLGASGAGKSTTINIISGIEKADNGKVLINDRDITAAFPQERDIATAFESYALYPHFTVYRNLMFPLEAPERRRLFSKQSKEMQVIEVAKMLGIEELLHRYPRELSGGQKQRVALGRTLVRRPQAYMLDEPIAHLDAKLRHRMRSELKKIQKDLGITTLYATPDQLEALSMGDTIAVLNKGKLEQIGTHDEIYYQPANLYVATFVGDPPMNIFEVDYKGAYAIVKFDTPYRVPIPEKSRIMLAEKTGGRRLIIGIRPKDIRLVSPSDPSSHVGGEVIFLDTLGQTSIVTVRNKTNTIKVKINSNELPEMRSTVGLEFDVERFFYFDAETAFRIG
ncbi:MAG: ABC transporter ATP-binding protein [Spirochaetota bacterium]